MKTIQLGKKFAVLISALILMSAALGSMLTQMYFPQLGKIAGQLEDPLEAWSETSYITWQYNSTYYACRNMSTNMVDYFGANDDACIQWGIDKCTTYGGTVYVKAPTYTGTYNAAVTLKDNVTLYIEKGTIGITVSFDAGADCTLIDEQNGFRKEYVAGVLYTFMDYRTGELWWQGENRTDTLAFPEQTASYIVFQDGSLTKMKNGTTGQIDASSMNASQIFEWCDGNLTNGGEIVAKNGDYQNVAIVISNSNITLQAESRATRLFGECLTLNKPVIKFDTVSNCKVRDFYIDGGGGNDWIKASAVMFSYTYNCELSGCEVANSPGRGAVFISRYSGNVVFNNYVHGGGEEGICAEYQCTDNKILNNRVENFQATGINLEYSCYRNLVDGNTITNCSPGIMLENGVVDPMNTGSNYNTVTNNIVNGSGGNGIRIGGACIGNIVSGNQIYGADDGIYMYGVNYTIVTENGINDCSNGIKMEYGADPEGGNGTCFGNQISFNTLIDCSTYGMAISGECINNIILGNIGNGQIMKFYKSNDYNLISSNYFKTISMNQATGTSDYNVFHGNYVIDINEYGGAGTGNQAYDNYPDNTI